MWRPNGILSYVSLAMPRWPLTFIYPQECEKAVKMQAFAEAIQTEETMPLSQTVNVDNIVVDPSYDGPRLDEEGGGGVTPAFLDALIERFTEQKLLHSKYVVMILLAVLKQFQSLPNIVEIKTSEAPVGRSGPSCLVVFFHVWKAHKRLD